MTLWLVAQVLFAGLLLFSGAMMVRAQVRLLRITSAPESLGSPTARDPASLIEIMLVMTRRARKFANEPQFTASAEQARRAYRGWQLTMICALIGLILIAFLMPR